MKEYTPIAMRCTQEQFDAIKPKLKGLMIEYISPFSDYNYLVNNLWGKEKLISNAKDCSKECFNREVHEEWNEEIFLKVCGVNTEINPLYPVFIERYNITDKVKALEDNVNKLLNNFENETGIVFEEINFKPRNTIFTNKDREYLISDLKIFIQR